MINNDLTARTRVVGEGRLAPFFFRFVWEVGEGGVCVCEGGRHLSAKALAVFPGLNSWLGMLLFLRETTAHTTRGAAFIRNLMSLWKLSRALRRCCVLISL